MRLGIRVLDNVASVNNWDYTEVYEMTQGDSGLFTVQIANMSKDRVGDRFFPAGRRYMPAPGATASIIFTNVDDAKVVTRPAVQPFTQDPSIWQVQVLPTDKLAGTVSVRLVLFEGSTQTTAVLDGGIRVASTTGLSCDT